MAYVPRTALSRQPPPIRIFEIPQLTRPGAVEPRPLLPSFVYLPAAHELPQGSTLLPWDENNATLVGELGRSMGASVPGRLVASAKSWLCSPSVDRTAAILPWGAPPDVQRLSPVEASARYLAHIREAWDSRIAKGAKAEALAAQDIVITVPASFDEAARELTVAAARLAGLPRVTLLEEPQAAFYAWLAAHYETLAEALASVRRVLVCDVGGGTTDFSLIDVQRSAGGELPLELKRVAVSDHLMLGGDNMDLALARHLENKVPGPLDAQQFKALTAAARDGKERLLSQGGPERISLSVLGRGSRAIGGSVRTELHRDEALRILLEGFFPIAPFDAELSTVARFGLREWGLPYVNDPAVTRHLSQFLRRHAAPGVPLLACPA
ncbi:MAG: Hsp70 family protein, partial [Planctomycetota bacterium]|nr:Hsp70 family protein [Planctomycetota bacterium]